MKTLAALMTVLALLAGCAQAPSKSSASLPPVVATDTTTRPRAMDAAPVSRGSLVPTSMIQSPSHRGLFEDRRPVRAGDTLMVMLNETTRASKLGGTQASRASGNSFGSNANIGFNSSGASSLSRARDAKLNAGTTGNTNFDSKGGSSASNEFSGMITVTVMEVLLNGNMVVAGEKRLAVGAEEEIIRFSGVVNPQNIQGGTIPSSMVADARIEYRGAGVTDEVQRPGWLTQLFMRHSPN
jgi:flagellar L-ring protein precursor FlgH